MGHIENASNENPIAKLMRAGIHATYPDYPNELSPLSAFNEEALEEISVNILLELTLREGDNDEESQNQVPRVISGLSEVFYEIPDMIESTKTGQMPMPKQQILNQRSRVQSQRAFFKTWKEINDVVPYTSDETESERPEDE